MDGSRPFREAPSPLDELREAAIKLKCGKAGGFCNISAALLKAESEVMTRLLHRRW